MSDGVMKSAVLMLAIGENEAAEVMKYLSPKEVQKLGAAMATLKSVGRDEVETTVNEFLTVADESSDFGLDSDEYIRSVLHKALGDKASNVLDRILQNRDSSGIESLKWMDAPTVAELIMNEHPQIIATILVHLEADHASEILSEFTDRLREDTLLRIATLDGVQPTALNELNDVLSKLLSSDEGNLKKQSMGGVQVAAEIMNYFNGDIEATAMESLKTYDEDLAQKIMDTMFVFDDIIEIDDKGIQVMLREVQSETLIIALKGTTAEMREKIFKNMSSRAAEMMREDLESKGPVKLSEVEAQQKQMLQIVRRLADEGQIMLGGKGSEDEYV